MKELTEPVAPTEKTLVKYGLSIEDWWALLESQGGGCGICGIVPSTGRFVIDHKHVKGWKKMPPEERKKYVRGMLCWLCNYLLVRNGITSKRLRAAADYLDRHGG